MNKEVQMNFKKIRGRIVITAGILAMTAVPQAVSASCVQTQNAGEVRQPAYLAAYLPDKGCEMEQYHTDFGKNQNCGSLKSGNSFFLTSDGGINAQGSERYGFCHPFWDFGFGGEYWNSGSCVQPEIGDTESRPDCGGSSQDGCTGESRPEGTPGDDGENQPEIGDNEGIQPEDKPENQPGEKPGSGSSEDENTSGGNTSEDQSSSYGSAVADLVNQQRSAKGLPSLSYDAELTRLAQMKAEDMAENNYFSHQSPAYGSAFDMLSSAGVSYRSAGENIARGQKTPEAVMDSWMNSQGHRENILSSSYTSIGVGYAADSSGRICWVQIFKG